MAILLGEHFFKLNSTRIAHFKTENNAFSQNGLDFRYFTKKMVTK